MSPAEKLAALKRLGDLRRASKVPEGCFALGDFHDGYYECDFVSPWTNSAQNVDASLMLVGQDWASAEYLSRPVRQVVRMFGYDPDYPTNRNLKSLLARAGLEFSDVFATNAFAYVKSGSASAQVKSWQMNESVSRFLIPQIEIVSPRIVACLGLATFNSIRSALGVRKCKSFDEALRSPMQLGNVRLLAFGHPGAFGVKNRGWPTMCSDWEGLNVFLA